MSKRTGTLIIIGGREDKEGERAILQEVVRPVAKGGGRKRLVIVTAATTIPQEIADDYRRVFRQLGVGHVDVLDIREREQAHDPALIKKLDDAGVIFFTGGDQLRLTSQLGGTPLFAHMLELHARGTVIAGTSAGAAAVPETMLISGQSEGSLRVSASTLGMAPGLGLLKGVIIDSHFAERGRLGRLLGAVAQNPYNLGIGIDEDTALVVQNERVGRVVGSGAVYVIDGKQLKYSSLSEADPTGVLRMHNLTLHVLGDGDTFDLSTRMPHPPAGASAAAG
jgi:cyanophycinase